jgi:uncharacterized membrane protein
MYSHYFDLGIMHQTTYNSYMAIRTGDMSRFLELTNPHETAAQVKRMSIHNDILLALLAPLYFIYAGPETLLVVQTVTLAMGAIFLYGITRHVFQKKPYSSFLGLTVGFSYLMYAPLQRANSFDFHPVTLSTTLFIVAFYLWLKKRYFLATLSLLICALTKEQVGLTVAFFGLFFIFEDYIHTIKNKRSLKSIGEYVRYFFTHIFRKRELFYAVFLMIGGVIWVYLSLKVIIPYSRGGAHFASDYYMHLSGPIEIIRYILRKETWEFLYTLLAPLGFLSVFAPFHFFIAAPDLLVNILSSNDNMRNIYYHYESVVTPFVFISAIYGIYYIYVFSIKKVATMNVKSFFIQVIFFMVITSLYYSYNQSSLPWAKDADVYPWKEGPGYVKDVLFWKDKLAGDSIKVSTTGHIAPHFTSRRYFYDFSWKYIHADYVVIEKDDALNGYLKNQTVPALKNIQKDKKYIKIYDKDGILVYQKLKSNS